MSAGKIQVKLHIVDFGKVEKAEIVTSTLSSKPFEKCLMSARSQLTFAAPPKDQIAVVIYPFVFANDEPTEVAPTESKKDQPK